MEFYLKGKVRNRSNLIIASIISIILIVGIIAGCSSAPVYRGWSGIAIDGNNLYIGSLNSKLVGLDATNRNKLFNDIPLAVASSGSFFSSCSGSSSSSQYIYGTPVVADGMIFVTTYSGKVYAYDSAKAIEQWNYPANMFMAAIVGGAAYADGKLYFGTNDGKVYAINASSGEQQTPTEAWNAPFVTGDKIWSTPVVSGDTLYVGSFDKSLYAINTTDGTEKWHYQTEGAIINTPVIKDGVVYFGSFDRYFYAVNATNGQLIWKFNEPAGKWFWANPVIAGNTIYAPNIDGKVYAFSIETGTMNKIDISTSPISSSPVLVGTKIFLAAEDGKLWALNTENNTSTMVINYASKIYAPLAASNSIVYTITLNNTLHALNTESGLDLWGPVSLGN